MGGRMVLGRAAFAGIIMLAPLSCAGSVAPEDAGTVVDSSPSLDSGSDAAIDSGCRPVAVPDGERACTTNDECPSDQYCGGFVGCPPCIGWCEPRITSCSGAQACGCDGKRYKNFCEAAFAGVRAGLCP